MEPNHASHFLSLRERALSDRGVGFQNKEEFEATSVERSEYLRVESLRGEGRASMWKKKRMRK